MIRPCDISTPKPGQLRAGPASGAPGFTLIELILVMALLTMTAAVSAPVLSRFFRGRALDSEARRLLALTREAQSRAVSEGVPVDLWVDAEKGAFGAQIEPSYEPTDPKAVDLALDSSLHIEVVAAAAANTNSVASNWGQPVIASAPKVVLAHPTLPTIRFLPDGSISDTSPEKLVLTGRDGESLWLAQASDHESYEIRNQDK